MDDLRNFARDEDSRDNRTGQGPTPHPREHRDTESETLTQTPVTDAITALNRVSSPSAYSQEEIDTGDTPLDEDMDSLVDPDVPRERMSNNLDVLDLDPTWRVESEEPDFMQDPGTTDIIEAIEEGEPYFPPTDPPIRSSRLENAEVLGGFSITSLESPTEPEELPIRVLKNDEEIAERVRRALLSDAYTSDLNIDVEVEDGVVFLNGQVRSIQDVEQAEQVAGSIPGVEEVQEELEIV